MPKHLDEVRQEALRVLTNLIETQHSETEKAVLIDDLFGGLRLVLWVEKSQASLRREAFGTELARVASPYWSGDIWLGNEGGIADRKLYREIWNEARPVGANDAVRLLERHRNREGWFQPPIAPPWNAVGGPPIVLFYSFKGGMGRSTAAAAFAIQRARLGERVAVVDFDLDAPGIGNLLAADEKGTTAQWGVVDYMLERPYGDVQLNDYYHACRRREITEQGEILVVPAGKVDRNYLGKLARADFEQTMSPKSKSPIMLLLQQIRTELKPDWLLIDTRTGLAEATGVLMTGLAHLHVLFGTASSQSMHGLELVLERLGEQRVRADQPQLDCLLVQAMVPDANAAATDAKQAFAERTEDAFAKLYYAADPEDGDEDRFWYVRDMESADAPHVPVPLSYQLRLAHFTDLSEVVDILGEHKEYLRLSQRIAERFGKAGVGHDDSH